MKVERWNTERDGPPTEAVMRRKLEMPGYGVRLYVYPRGTFFPSHAHDVDKIDAVLAGRFRITIERECHRLGVGDMLAVPRGAIHEAAVEGDIEVVSLDAVRTR